MSTPFKPRKSFVLVGSNGSIVHLSDNRKMLKKLSQAGDRIERCIIKPLDA